MVTTEARLTTFEIGACWEGSEWEIREHVKCNDLLGGVPCPHCSQVEVEVHKRFDDGAWEQRVWFCPRVVVAYNEGGYDSTGICLDCILEKARTL